MDLSTAYINDKFDYLNVNSDGLKIDYRGEIIGTLFWQGYSLYHKCIKSSEKLRNLLAHWFIFSQSNTKVWDDYLYENVNWANWK